MSRKRLGEILLQAGVLELKDLRAALHEQLRWGGPLGRILVDMKLISEAILIRALSRQLGVKPVALDDVSVAENIIALIPAELAERHGLVPFRIDGDTLEVAMGDPTRSGLITELELHSQMTVRACIAGPTALERAVARYYGRGAGMLNLTLGKAGVASAVSLEERDWLEETSGVIVTDDRSRADQTQPLPDEPSVRAAVNIEAIGSSSSASSPTVTPNAASKPANQPISHKPSRQSNPFAGGAEGASGAPDRVSGLALAGPATARVDPRDGPRLTTGNHGAAAASSGSETHIATLRAEVKALQTRVSTLEALLSRDEEVLRKLLALLIEKRVATREEVLKRIK